MIAIVDYGVGNLFSLTSSFRAIGRDAIVTSDKSKIKNADKIILPGVGAFRDAYNLLAQSGLDEFLKEQVKSGKELMGVCLGMQLLFEKSFEFCETPGLGMLAGKIMPIEDDVDSTFKIPHIGWNKLHFDNPNCKLLKYINEGNHVYFVHSYYAINCDDSLVASTDYGTKITALVAKDNVYGCQFHPEKSGDVGLKILKAFCED